MPRSRRVGERGSADGPYRRRDDTGPPGHEAVIRNARALNPAIHVIVRAPGTGDVSGLSAGGADEVVQPEFEAGLEFVRQVLGWQGIDNLETDDLVSARRQTVYGTREPDAALERGIESELEEAT